MQAIYILLVVGVLVIVGGLAYILRPYDRDSFTLSEREEVEQVPLKTTTWPPPEESKPKIYPINQKVTVTLKTNKGDIRLELDGTVAPVTVGNFVELARQNFYDGTTFHRVIPEFMIQGGDPLSRDQAQRETHGTGGPGYMFQDEINNNKITRGTVAMANAGPNTNGSQFFIVTAEATPHLDGRHTYFGRVISGMEIVDVISQVERDERDNPVEPVVIEDVIVHDAPVPPDALHFER